MSERDAYEFAQLQSELRVAQQAADILTSQNDDLMRRIQMYIEQNNRQVRLIDQLRAEIAALKSDAGSTPEDPPEGQSAYA